MGRDIRAGAAPWAPSGLDGLNGRLTLFFHLSFAMSDDVPLLSMLKDRMSYLDQRQKLIAQNVANSDTPGFAPQDLKPFAVSSQGTQAPLQLAPVRSGLPGASMIPLAPATPSTPWAPQAAPDSETRVDGNQVVLEEEMMKMNDARMNYEAAIGFYQKSISMLQTAMRTPGKGS
jgi:flagellar basal-body rod protein FlgB